jgi:hypothetical protein
MHPCSVVETHAEGARYQLMMCRNQSIVDAVCTAQAEALFSKQNVRRRDLSPSLTLYHQKQVRTQEGNTRCSSPGYIICTEHFEVL